MHRYFESITAFGIGLAWLIRMVAAMMMRRFNSLALRCFHDHLI